MSKPVPDGGTPTWEPGKPGFGAADAGAAGVATAAADEDDDKPFYLKLPVAIGAVVGLAVVLVGANVYMKKKKKAAEEGQ